MEMKGGLKLTASDTTFHINRCAVCGRLITKLEVVSVLDGKRPLPLCPCGANKIKPSNPKWWEYMLPRVVWLAIQIKRGKVSPGVAV